MSSGRTARIFNGRPFEKLGAQKNDAEYENWTQGIIPQYSKHS